MENLALIAPLIILFPAIGAFINFFWGAKLGEGTSAIIGSTASALSFFVALGLLSYLTGSDFNPAVVDPPLLDGWLRIDSINLDISWQTRVDTLSVTMTLFVTFVGTLIHIYAAGYMHGDERFSLFFAYLNMFLAFMLILIMGNNYLMMFVGWEGVGLSSYLLISFWWDKPKGEGIANSNAGRKAFIANRIGDFGVLMAVFLTFWAFGTLDYYKPNEIPNPAAGVYHGDDHAEEADEEESEASEEEARAPVQLVLAGDVLPDMLVEEIGGEADAEEESGRDFYSFEDAEVDLAQLGVFGQVARYVEMDDEASTLYDEAESVLLQARGDDDEAAIAEAEAAFALAQEEADAIRPTFEIGPLTLGIEGLLTLITLFMLLGVTGKSAQIPLFVWLPDAMAGPTPVSALIHAATMVTAGVYIMVRSNIMFYNAELVSFLVAMVGATTALVAGFIAVGQFDIKRVLAYSTVSQLGFMVAAVGLGAYVAAMFHMITHAFFKALLFLGSGSVIHGVEHGHHHVAHHGHHDDDHHDDDFDPQDMRNMGGLSKRMPITYWTYLFGTIALAGIWPFAGFWSKDEILADAWLVGFDKGELKGFLVLGLLLIAAGFTAFYMWRQIEMVFHGEPRTEAAAEAPESAPSMVIPLVILAFFALFIGFVNIPSGIGFPFTLGFEGTLGLHALGDFLEYSIFKKAFVLPPFTPLIALTALGAGIGAIILARSIYGGTKAIDENGKDPLQAEPSTGMVWNVAHARMYWDEIYFALIINPYIRVADFLANVIDWRFLHDYFHDSVIVRGYRSMGELLSRPFDLGIIDGSVNGVGRVITWISGSLRRVQTGYVRTYAVALLLGVVAVILLMLLPLIQIG
jgi:NADH:ubiquinone oxidoreductase subunit 5 (subunit L)/multisubunit Na+/H+ antiporter MnhA subunit